MQSTKKLETSTRHTLLASAGVIDNARELFVTKVDQIFVEGTSFLNELLEKGESVEKQLQEKFKAKDMLASKLSALRKKFGIGSHARDQHIDMLSQKVDGLIEVVAKLAQQKADEKKAAEAAAVKKAPAKPQRTTRAKTAADKTTATEASSAKAGESKTPAAKPTARKAPAKPRTRKAATGKKTDTKAD